MLGKLAKWLRLFGFDVLYYSNIEDRQVIKIAREQQRIVLTRDTRMLRSRGITDAVFISSDHVFEQLMEMKDRLDFSDPALAERCILCNSVLQAISDKNEVKDFFPDYVYHNFERFTRCADCGKIYWEGSHYRNIRERIKKIPGISSED